VEVQVLSSASFGSPVSGYDRRVDAKKFGEAGLVGWRGRAGKRLAEWASARTRLDKRTLASAIGAYLFVARTRRMIQMLRRLRRAA
jgi:hypothetical protein